jgi:hypothetical protein
MRIPFSRRIGEISFLASRGVDFFFCFCLARGRRRRRRRHLPVLSEAWRGVACRCLKAEISILSQACHPHIPRLRLRRKMQSVGDAMCIWVDSGALAPQLVICALAHSTGYYYCSLTNLSSAILVSLGRCTLAMTQQFDTRCGRYCDYYAGPSLIIFNHGRQ